MKEAELKTLYIKRMHELMQSHKISKNQALNSVYKPLIQEVTPLHTSSMAAAVNAGIVYRELVATGEYDKKRKGK